MQGDRVVFDTKRGKKLSNKMEPRFGSKVFVVEMVKGSMVTEDKCIMYPRIHNYVSQNTYHMYPRIHVKK